MPEPLVPDFSLLGILVAAVALFVLGAIWYTGLFGKVYRAELGVPEPAQGASAMRAGPAFARALVGQFAASLVIAIVLAWLVGNTSAGYGALVGLAGGVLVAAALAQLHQFEGKSLRYLFLHIGYFLIGVTAVGAILGAFQAG